MPTVSHKAFKEKAEKIKTNIINDLEDYYGDPLEWEDASTDLVKYGIFYSNSCNQLLKAALLYGYETKPFAKKFLASEKENLNAEKYQRHHYSLLMQYAIDQVMIGMLLKGELDISKLQKASEYHYISLKEYGYLNEVDAARELDAETLLSTFVPQMIVKILLDVDYSEVFKCIDPEIRSSEAIWMYAWRLLHAFVTQKSGNGPIWNDLVLEWKSCFLKMNFHGFSNSLFVLLYFLYCRSSGRNFNIEDLSQEICEFQG